MVRRAGNAFWLAYILAGTAAWQEYTYNKDDCKGFFDHTIYLVAGSAASNRAVGCVWAQCIVRAARLSRHVVLKSGLRRVILREDVVIPFIAGSEEGGFEFIVF